MLKPPKHLVDQWPEVFTDLEMNTMPVAYINNVRLDFSDGSVWEIDVKSQILSEDPAVLAERLAETIEDHQERIIKIDFNMDVERLIEDIKLNTNNIF